MVNKNIIEAYNSYAMENFGEKPITKYELEYFRDNEWRFDGVYNCCEDIGKHILRILSLDFTKIDFFKEEVPDLYTSFPRHHAIKENKVIFGRYRKELPHQGFDKSIFYRPLNVDEMSKIVNVVDSGRENARKLSELVNALKTDDGKIDPNYLNSRLLGSGFKF